MTRFGTLNGDLSAAQVVEVLAQSLTGVVATNARVVVHTIGWLGLLLNIGIDQILGLGIVAVLLHRPVHWHGCLTCEVSQGLLAKAGSGRRERSHLLCGGRRRGGRSQHGILNVNALVGYIAQGLARLIRRTRIRHTAVS
jgi:hypothetical protein